MARLARQTSFENTIGKDSASMSNLQGALTPKFFMFGASRINQGAPKERRRGCAEKRLSKRVFLKSPFLLCPLKVCS